MANTKKRSRSKGESTTSPPEKSRNTREHENTLPKPTEPRGQEHVPHTLSSEAGAGSPLSFVAAPLSTEFRAMERWVRERLDPSLLGASRPAFSLISDWWRKLAMRGRSDTVDPYGKDPIFCARASAVLEFLFSSYFRVECSGMEQIPSSGRAILVANHAGVLPYDVLMLMHGVRTRHPARRELRPLVEDTLYHLPHVGPMLSRLGAVRACQENAVRLLGEERLVAVFPEGAKGTGKPYRRRYQLERFGRGGFVKLAIKTRSPIVPVAIVGAEETSPLLFRIELGSASPDVPLFPVTPTFPLLGPLGLVPLPVKWFIQVGQPLALHALHGPDEAEDRLLIARLAENLRRTIGEMLAKLLSERRSIFFG